MNNPLIYTFSNEDEFWQSAKEDTLLSIKEALTDYEECRIGLAGGSTPKALYAALADENLPWDRIHLIQIDERYVSSDDPQSNLNMIRNTLTKKIPIPPENLTFFDTALPLQKAAQEMDRQISAIKQERTPIFDLLILGAGKDGHIASLFEGDEALHATNLAATANPNRLTLTIPALKSSSRVLLLLKGEEKSPVITALQGEAEIPTLTALRQVIDAAQTKVLFLS
jgi:6-phosphogluconolactonase